MQTKHDAQTLVASKIIQKWYLNILEIIWLIIYYNLESKN
jgi:hypothetical protein